MNWLYKPSSIIVAIFAIFSCQNSFGVGLTMQDISIMSRMGVRIAFPSEGAHIVPQGISPSKLIQTELLDLSSMRFEHLPTWIKNFPNLRKVDLSNTKVDVESAIIDLSLSRSKYSLEIINFSGCKFKNASGSATPLNNFPNLKKVDLSYTSPTGTNRTFKNLCVDGLLELSLEGNDLHDGWISDFNEMNLSCMNSLRVLNLAKTDIDLDDLSVKSIPISIESLDLTGNNGDTLNPSFGNSFSLPNLIQLKIDGYVAVPSALKKRLKK